MRGDSHTLPRMAPAALDERPEPVAAESLPQGSDGSDGAAGSDKDEDETKFVEWDPTGRFGRVRDAALVHRQHPRRARARVGGRLL